MKSSIRSIFVLLVLVTVGLGSGGAQSIMYSVAVKSDTKKSVVVKRSGKELFLELRGFGGDPLRLKATGGGVGTCRTILEHHSRGFSVILSLPIADPRAPCRKLPGFVTVEIADRSVSVDDEEVKKVSGTDARLRSAARSIFGEIDSEEGE